MKPDRDRRYYIKNKRKIILRAKRWANANPDSRLQTRIKHNLKTARKTSPDILALYKAVAELVQTLAQAGQRQRLCGTDKSSLNDDFE